MARPVRRTDLSDKVYVFAWANKPRRAELKGRRSVIEARGALGAVLVCFVDTEERVTTGRRAIREV